MFRPGPRNLITDVPGILVGHATDERRASGVTVLRCSDSGAAAVDVRGGAPGTRETEVLAAENLVGRAHAIVLSGGSVFGLAAADGVTAALSVAGIGLALRPDSPAVPIVPAGVLYDLANGGDKSWGVEPPYRSLGIQALEAAGADFALGSVGAGRGAMAGLRKGGLGSASLDLGDGVLVGALVAVNPVGSVVMADGLTYWAWPFELEGEFGGGRPGRTMAADPGNPAPDDTRLKSAGRMQPGVNTTLAIVASSAVLTAAECRRVAIMAQDGIARAIRPAHTPFDGDTVFAVSGSDVALAPQFRAAEVGRLGSASADCVARAIARAVHHAQ